MNLINPKTENYLRLKEEIFSCNFPWHYIPTTVPDEDNKYASAPYFSHAIVRPPSNPNLFPSPYSSYAELSSVVVSEIGHVNKLNINCILRINVNMTLPLSNKPTQPHHDHSFPHNNMLIYLNDCDGETVVDGCKYLPKEDSIIVFNGMHYHYFPTKNRRVVIVVTYI